VGNLLILGFMRCQNSDLSNEENILVTERDSGRNRELRIENISFGSGSTRDVGFDIGSYDDWTASRLFDGADVYILNGQHVYFEEQAPGYVPVSTQEEFQQLYQSGWLDNHVDDDPSNIVGKTNKQLDAAYGFSVFGSLMPDSTVSSDLVDGGRVVPTTESDSVWADAETASIDQPWQVEDDPDAANGQFVSVDGIGDWNKPSDTNHNTYTFAVDGGEYELFARIFSKNSSVWVRIDDGEWFNWNMRWAGRGWEWQSMANSNSNDSRESFSLSAGNHRVQLAHKEDGLNLDKIHLAKTDQHPIGKGE